jgi:hypothetical protein
VSVRASTAVWDYSAAPNNTVLIVALVLADHADYDGQVWVSAASVAAQARVGRSTVYNSISTLEALGELERIRSGGKGPGDVTTYRLTLVDKLRKRVHHVDTYKGPKSVQKESTLLDTIRRDVDTYKGDAREKRDFAVEWDERPPMPDPKELANRIADVRTRIGRPERGPA